MRTHSFQPLLILPHVHPMEPHCGVTHKVLVLGREYFIARHHLELHELVTCTVGMPVTHIASPMDGGRGGAPLLSSLHLDPNTLRILTVMTTYHLLPQNNNSRLSPAFMFSSLVLYNYINEKKTNIPRKSTAVKQRFPCKKNLTLGA